MSKIGVAATSRGSSPAVVDEPPYIIYPSGRLGAVTRKRNQIIELLQSKSTENVALVTTLFDELMSKKDCFISACNEQQSIDGVDPSDKTEFISWTNNHLASIDEFISKVEIWLGSEGRNIDLSPGDSASQVTKSSQRSSSSVISVRAKMAQRRAKLNADQKLFDEEASLKQSKYELERQEKKLLLKREDIELQNLERELEKIESPSISSNLEQPVAVAADVNAGNVVDKGDDDVPALLLKGHSMYRLPFNEPEKFDGTDITKFQPFVLAFERTIASRCSNYVDRYYYLQRYTGGRARDLVVSCNGGDSRTSYEEAWKLLQENYGDDYLIAHQYLEKLDQWPAIAAEDVSALGDFYTYICTCNNLMKNMNHLNQLNSLKTIKDLVMKLPYDLRKQFRIEMASIYDTSEIKFSTFVAFVSRQLKILRLPLFGSIRDENRTSSRSFSRTSVKPKSFATSFKNSKQNSDAELSCLCCSKNNHSMDSCYFFKNKSITDRENFIKEKNICFGCLNSTDHRSRDCNSKLTCDTCQKLHPTSLHKQSPDTEVSIPVNPSPPPESTDSSTLNTSSEPTANAFNIKNSLSNKVLCPAVPVAIRRKNSDKFVYTYMGLDNFATACYIDGDLLKDIGYESTSTIIDLTTMENKCSPVSFNLVKDLEIFSLCGKNSCKVPSLYAKGDWPFDISDSPTKPDLDRHDKLSHLPFQFINCKIGLLIGVNCPELVKPLEIVNTSKYGPYATRHLLGWALSGPRETSCRSNVTCFYTKTNSVSLDEKIDNIFNSEFHDDPGVAPSINDQIWCDKVSKSIRRTDSGHFEIALPFDSDNVKLPNNYSQIRHRLTRLTSQLSKNESLYDKYASNMKMLREKEFVELVPRDKVSAPPGKVWYIAHHGVIHKLKDKFRTVFDCSLKFNDVSLNDVLLQGPDLTNSLLGVLLRFRQGKFAFTADIEKMFYMVKLPESDRDFMRFLWYKDDDIRSEPVQFRLTVHVFGAKSSPSCANFALRHSVLHNNFGGSDIVKYAVLNSFYVDDLMVSMNSERSSIDLINEVIEVLQINGFNLTGFVSNSRNILNNLDRSKLSDKLQTISLDDDKLPCDRALGIVWNVERDTLGFRLNTFDQPCTKRGILSQIFSIYDPFFIVCPAIIRAKRIFQQACALKLSWDDLLPEPLLSQWKFWKLNIIKLNTLEIPRSFVPNPDTFKQVQLHVFCDGSQTAYGAVAYLRCSGDSIGSCSIIMAKVRLTPLGRASLKTIPRIELNAAKVATELYLRIIEEISLNVSSVTFWCDSTIVLRYIQSNNGRFQRFVANRIAFIRTHTSVSQWRFVPGEINPSDLLSRGSANVDEFLANKNWFTGPEFLKYDETRWPDQSPISEVVIDDSETIKTTFVAKSGENVMIRLFNSVSSWYKLKFRISVLTKFVNYVMNKNSNKIVTPVDAHDLDRAESVIFLCLQKSILRDQRELLIAGKPLPKSSCLVKCRPYIDDKGYMRVGGRLTNSSVSYEIKYPIIVPMNQHVLSLFIKHCHSRLGHLGREVILAQVRSKYHIIGINALIKRVLFQCVICKRVQGRVSNQIMSDLPRERLSCDEPPFSHVGVDYFGPFFVVRGRGKSRDKRYGVIFSCMSSRAVHIEISYSLDMDSLVNCLRRFVCRRGPVKTIVSDNGTNLVAGNKELIASIGQWNQSQMNSKCKNTGVTWKFNPPNASHYGGVYEREIRTIRKVLNSLLCEFENLVSLSDEVLSTLMCEVENILNNRPLTSVTNDMNDLDALTPNHLLRFQTSIEYPIGVFSKEDIYLRKRWRRVQFAADTFWSRWRREYMPNLLDRQKWYTLRRNHAVGDLVLVTDQLLPRNMWCLGRIESVKVSSDGQVRSAFVKVSRCKQGKDIKYGCTTLHRPVTKLVLVKTIEELLG